MTPFGIWLAAAIFYVIFWSWYVGFRRKVAPDEVTATMTLYEGRDFTQKQKQAVERFLTNDDGKDFVVVNLFQLKAPVRESRKKLAVYEKVYMSNLLRNAGHPVVIARAASANIENVACEHADDWMAASMIRYRSRRDLMETLEKTIGSEHHQLKLESLEKTFAFPASPWTTIGGPRLVVALALALLAALTHLLIV